MASKNYVFYKICSDDCDEIYVGSTVNFNSRKKDHKIRCYSENDEKYNRKIYQIIRANGGWDNFKMIQIGTRDNITKREAEQIEEEYRIQLKASMNTNRAFLSEEIKKERGKEYRQNNKEKIAKQDKEYRQNNKEKIAEQMKDYYENNKEKLKEYRQNNKEKIAKRDKEKIICEICNVEIARGNKSRHIKSARHCEFIKVI